MEHVYIVDLGHRADNDKFDQLWRRVYAGLFILYNCCDCRVQGRWRHRYVLWPEGASPWHKHNSKLKEDTNVFHFYAHKHGENNTTAETSTAISKRLCVSAVRDGVLPQQPDSGQRVHWLLDICQ